MMVGRGWPSGVMNTRRTLMGIQNTCTPTKYYHRVVHEKAASALETSRLLSSPSGLRQQLS
jgi:hypothetical protein